MPNHSPGARVLLASLSLACAVAVLAQPVYAQDRPAVIEVEVRTPDGPVPGAVVRVGDRQRTTSAEGIARLDATAGRVTVVVSHDGYVEVTVEVDAEPGQTVRVPVTLVPSPTVEEEVVVVASTRTGRRIEDQPTRVEVVGREEIEEKMLMTPGDIVMMLNEMGGLRVQTTSPSLGAAAVRIQGMQGRYTSLLSDGLPLFGEQPGGIGLLQIPPMDLGQVEVIKGVASALYGAGAMAGVVNLLSRRPGESTEQEVLANGSTRGATDGVYWLSSPLGERGGLTLLASGHNQERVDVDGDGWADLASYTRGVLRPRVVWDDGTGRSVFATVGVTTEDRAGGTVDSAVLPATGEPYREALETTRVDAGVVAQALVSGRYVATARAAFMSQRHDHAFGDVRERDRHTTAFGEAAIRGASGSHTWVAGLAIEYDDYDPTDVPRFAYSFTAPGVFVQDDFDIRPWLLMSGSVRADWHSEYGTFVSPRVSLLVRGGGWSSRVSLGTGFYAATPLTEETEAAGLTRLELPAPLEAERGRSLSFDIGRATEHFSWTTTVFASRVEDAVTVDREDAYRIRNLDGPTTSRGVELLATYRREPFAVTGSYTFVDAVESEAGVERDVPMTPRHSAGVVAMIEGEDWGRVGVEVYFTGSQSLEADPYRSRSEPYLIVGILAERRLGRMSLFVNGENLTNVRQTKWGTIVRPARGVDGRWTVDAWAPLDGVVVNGGLRLRF